MRILKTLAKISIWVLLSPFIAIYAGWKFLLETLKILFWVLMIVCIPIIILGELTGVTRKKSYYYRRWYGNRY